jgi:HEAT repeat protein
MLRIVSETCSTGRWLCLPVLVCLLASLTSCGGDVMPPPADELTPPPSPEAAKWLAIAEDEGKDIHERIAAVVQLQKLKEEATADRLIKLLPGDYDALTLETIEALAAIRSPRALPAFKKMYHDKTILLPGKLNSALAHAIRACGGGDPDAPRR